MYRVTETGRRAKNVSDLEDARMIVNERIATWPAPFDDIGNHHQFDSFKRYGVHKLAILSASKTTTIAIERTWP